MTRRTALGVCCALLLVVPAGAQAAGTVAITGSQVTFQAAAGISNDVTVTTASGSVTVTDAADVITEAEGDCAGTGTNTVTCSSPAINSVRAGTGDMNDRVGAGGTLGLSIEAGAGDDEISVTSTPGSGRASVIGEDGNDRITTGDGDEFVSSGPGTDLVATGGGNDIANTGTGSGDNIDMGPGNDVIALQANDGADSVTGGPGRDTLNVSGSGADPPVEIVVDLEAGTVTSPATGPSAATQFEDAEVFERANTTVRGTAGSNAITTFTSADLVDPGTGQDLLTMGAGPDRAVTRDGFPDSVLCGAGDDSADVDQLDLTVGCERVEVAQVRPAATALGAPGCRIVSLRSRVPRRALLRRGLGGAVECARPASLEIRLLARAARRGGGIGIARAGDVILAERSLPLGGGRRAVRLRVARRLRASVPRSARLRLQVVARDEFGNAEVVTRRVRVVSPRPRAR